MYLIVNLDRVSVGMYALQSLTVDGSKVAGLEQRIEAINKVLWKCPEIFRCQSAEFDRLIHGCWLAKVSTV